MLKALMKDSVSYGLANLIQKLVPLFLIPIVTYYLGQTALKIYDVSFVYAFLVSWLIIMGQDSAAAVFYFDQKKTNFNSKEVLTYSFFIQGLFLVIFSLLFLPFKESIATFLFSADKGVAVFWLKALLIIPGHIMLNYALNVLLWQKRRKHYIFLCLLQTLLSVVSVYIFIGLRNGTVADLFNCLIVSITISGLAGIFLIKSNINFRLVQLNRPLIKKLLFFGLPFALTSFFHQLLPAIDRIFLLQFHYSHQLPSYILAVKIGALIGLGISGFVLAFTPYSMAKLNDKHAEEEVSELFYLVSIAAFVLVPSLLIFKDLLIVLFADPSYRMAANLLPFFFFGWMFDLFSYFSMLGLYRSQNSLPILLLFVFGTILISLFNILLIPVWGVYGAAFSFCLTKLLLFLIPLIWFRKHFKIAVNVPGFLFFFLIGILCSYLIYQLELYITIIILVTVIAATIFYLSKQKLQWLHIGKA